MESQALTTTWRHQGELVVSGSHVESRDKETPTTASHDSRNGGLVGNGDAHSGQE